MIATIAQRELKSLLVSPLSWFALAFLQFLFAYLFFSRIELFLQYQPRLRNLDNAPGISEIVANGLFSYAGLIFLILIPIFCSRSLAEERRSGTLKLLYSSPISLTQLVVGKYLGLGSFFFLIILLLALMAFSLQLGGNLSLAHFASGLLGLILLSASSIAITLCMSAFTSQSSVAAISSFSLLFFLWIIKWSDTSLGTFSTYLSLQEHFNSMLSGVLASVDVIYFLLLIFFFLGLTLWRLDRERG